MKRENVECFMYSSIMFSNTFHVTLQKFGLLFGQCAWTIWYLVTINIFFRCVPCTSTIEDVLIIVSC